MAVMALAASAAKETDHRGDVRHYAKADGQNQEVSPHVWRHTCATHLVSNGANIAYAQLLLGHRTLRTTQIYTRVSVPEIKVTHAETHPRKAEPSPTEIETAHAPLQSLPMKMRATYHYKSHESDPNRNPD